MGSQNRRVKGKWERSGIRFLFYLSSDIRSQKRLSGRTVVNRDWRPFTVRSFFRGPTKVVLLKLHKRFTPKITGKGTASLVRTLSYTTVSNSLRDTHSLFGHLPYSRCPGVRDG